MSVPASSAGGDEARRALVALAGALAEQGVGQVEIVRADGERKTLRARETDLPGVLTACGLGSRLWAGSIDLEVEIDATGPRCVRCGTEAARNVERAVRAHAGPGAG